MKTFVHFAWGCFAWFLAVALARAQEGTARLSIRELGAGEIELSWPSTAQGAVLEQTDSLAGSVAWVPLEVLPILHDGEYTVILVGGAGSRFVRLRQELTHVIDSSPVSGETEVAVTRETMVYFSAPLASNTVLSTDHFYAGIAGRRLLSRVELSGDRRKATLFYLEPLPGSTRVTAVFDGTAIRDFAGADIDADGDGLPGGVAIIAFDTLSLTPLVNTAVIGTVYASELAPGSDTGTNAVNRPLAGVTITVDGLEQSVRAVTDVQGQFTLRPVPPGRFFVHIDGRTVTNSAAGIRYPDKAYYPAVGKAWDAVAGVTNNQAGGTGTIFLPLIKEGTLQSVSVTQDTSIAFPPSVISSNPALAGVSITVKANSLFSDNGTRGGKVGIAPVAPDRLPGPLPPGLAMPLVITVQTDGGLNFDQPAPICFPNLPDPVLGVPLLAGSQQALISFDHKKGIWEAVGTMTVSADGRFICSDPGAGVVQPGWHGVGPPPFDPPGCSELCCESEDNDPLGGLGLLRREFGLSRGTKPKPANCRKKPCQGDQFNCERACLTERRLCDTEAARAEDACFKVLLRGKGCGTNFTSECNFLMARCNELFQQLSKPACRTAVDACLFECKICPEDAVRRAGARTASDQDLVAAQIQVGFDEISGLLQPYISTASEIPPAVGMRVFEIVAMVDTLAGGDASRFLSQYALELEQQLAARVSAFGEPTGNAPPYPVLYRAEIARGAEMFVLRGETGPFGQYSLFVPRDGELLQVSFYDPRTKQIGNASPHRRPGARHRMPRFNLQPVDETFLDGDSDGVVDVVESFYGTDPRKSDSDGDGIADGAEIEQGTDPLGGFVVQTGVIATLKTGGAAVDIWTGNGLAILAEGTSGVSLIDISTTRKPTIIGRVNTPGTALRVAASGDLVLVADGGAGVAVLDISEPASASILHQINVPGAQAVAAGAGIGYIGFGSGRVVSVNLREGTILSQATLPSAVQDLALAGDSLYALTGDRLHVMSLVDGNLVGVGSALSPFVSTQNRRLFVGGDVAYTVHGKGYNTLDVSNPAKPVLLQAGNTAQFGWRQIVANGSGLGLAAVGPNNSDDGPHEISLYDVSSPRTNNAFITTFTTPGNARAVSIFNGLTYVADDLAGLQVVNYLPYDAKGVPPTIALTTVFSAGRAEEGKLMRVTAQVGDDVQVRHVEFYLDGKPAFTDAAFPFEFRFVTPRRSAGVNAFRLRARAFDTGGNFTWTEEMLITLVPDATPPRVTHTSPLGGAKSLSRLTAHFDSPMAAVTLNAGTFKLFSAGNDGVLDTADDPPINGGEVAYLADSQVAALTFASALPQGRYRAVLTSSVTDLAGNGLASEYAWQFRVADAVFWTRTEDGIWNDPLNWSTGRVPGASDDVIIDVLPAEVTVTHSSGPISVRNLESHARFHLDSGILQAAGDIWIAKNMTISGATIRGGTVTQAAGARILFGAQTANTLDGVSVVGDLDLTSLSARLLIRNGLTLAGTVRLDNGGAIGFAGVQTFNTGSIVFGANIGYLSVEGGATLTLGPAMVVRGKSGILGQPVFLGGNGKLINQGVISSDVAGGNLNLRPAVFENAGRLEQRNGGSIVINNGTWSNAGTMEALGGTLTLDGNFTNTGTIQATNATVNLDGDFTLARLGTFQRTGGTVNLRTVLPLNGGTLALDATTGSWVLNGGTIRNGTLTESGGARMLFGAQTANTFDGMSVVGDLDLTSLSARLLIRNGLTLAGTVRLDNGGAIGFAGVQTFNTGSIVFGANIGYLSVEGGATLTLGPAMVVRGKSGILGQPVFLGGNGKLINQGLISADVAGGTLTIRPAVFTNTGKLEEKNGGRIMIIP